MAIERQCLKTNNAFLKCLTLVFDRTFVYAFLSLAPSFIMMRKRLLAYLMFGRRLAVEDEKVAKYNNFFRSSSW